ncbi:MAG TPA: BTAD domain-containing putative transcriptional regulator [Candidatus Limnocylindrales bacterium]|nr:BTAD domain-containing putative transcriptional regulator [Candidatus Limnocylindrales bacterium]
MPLLARADSTVVVELRCFERFELAIRGQPFNLGSLRPRARVVMRYLALHANHPVHRDSLLADLWPATSSRTATRSLHVTLSTLRGFLGQLPGVDQGMLVRDGDAYRLVIGERCRVDVADFRAAVVAARQARGNGNEAVRAQALERAIDVYAGELLPEDGIAEWVVGPREQLRQQAAQCTLDLAQLKLAGGDAVAAAQLARACVNIDRYRDDGWRALIRAYEDLGSHAAAANARHDYALILESLGLDSAGAYYWR